METYPPSAHEAAIDAAPLPKKAAVIDDAFDDVEQGEIAFSDFKEFYFAAQEENDLDTILERLAITPPDMGEWEDDSPEYLSHLQVLWTNRTDEQLLQAINTPKLFASKLGKLKELDDLCRNIASQDIEVSKFKSKIDDLTIFQDGEFVYIFIDYNLGVKPGPDAIQNAQHVIRDIYDACPKGNKPVTVLMSTDPRIEQLSSDFQQEVGLLEGVFRVSTKDDLGDSNKISLLVRAYKEEFYCNHKLQEYVQALIKAAKEAQDEFEKEVKTLRIEDYEFIQHSVLKEQQQPLGDYLAWLYSSHWANLLLRNQELKDKQIIIDKVIAEKAPLHHTLPSEKLSEIFMSALFEEGLGALQYHPWEGVQEGVPKLAYLHLGDLFTKKEDTKVFMILNPQCDLERPKEEKKEQSIMLLPGRLESLDSKENESSVTTDFFVLNENRYMISWHLKQIKTISYKDFDDWYNGGPYERKFRLRLPFALAIQQRFTSDMSRVGLPVSPPLTRAVEVEVLYRKFDNELTDLLPRNSKIAFLPVTRSGKPELRLTLKFALTFKAAVIEHRNELRALESRSVESMPKNLEKSIGQLDQFIAGFDDWFFQNRNVPFPKENSIKQIYNSFLSVTLDAPQGSMNTTQTPFLLNVITKATYAIEVLVPEGKPTPDALAKGIILEQNQSTKIEIQLEEKTATATATVEAGGVEQEKTGDTHISPSAAGSKTTE